MTLNLAVILEESVKNKPEKPALILDDTIFTYAELGAAAKKFANALVSLGIEPDDKVALMVPNVPQFAIAYYGILNVGASVVPLNVLLKGAELTHSNMFMNALCNADKLLGLKENDVGIAVLPLFHIFGQTCVMNAFVYSSSTIVLVPRFEPEAALKAIQSAGVTVFQGVPTMYQYLLRHPELDEYDTSSLRLGVSGGASMPIEVLKESEERFGIVILEGYGLSETSPTACFNRSEEQRKVGSIGLPIWGTEAKVVDEEDNEVPCGERGELVLKGHHVMKGYYKKLEETKEAMKNGWFHTGDVATMDKDGFVFIVDRVKDMIVRGGYNVYPREIEEAIYEHEGVAEVAVIGVPHEELGEEVAAVVAMKEGASTTEEEVITFTKERLASYKYPRRVTFMDELPKTATGKILKRELVAAQKTPTS